MTQPVGQLRRSTQTSLCRTTHYQSVGQMQKQKQTHKKHSASAKNAFTGAKACRCAAANINCTIISLCKRREMRNINVSESRLRQQYKQLYPSALKSWSSRPDGDRHFGGIQHIFLNILLFQYYYYNIEC